MAPPDAQQISDDLTLMTGGNFTGVALGMPAYQDVLDRAQADAGLYLDAFEARFLGAGFDAVAQSNHHLPVFLQLLAPVAPDRVRALAERLHRQYDAVLVIHDAAPAAALQQVLPEETVNLTSRLDSRRRQLNELIKTLPKP